jgi:hypothetical protein
VKDSFSLFLGQNLLSGAQDGLSTGMKCGIVTVSISVTWLMDCYSVIWLLAHLVSTDQ